MPVVVAVLGPSVKENCEKRQLKEVDNKIQMRNTTFLAQAEMLLRPGFPHFCRSLVLLRVCITRFPHYM